MTETDDPIAAARAAGLRYTPAGGVGISRVRAAKDFRTWAGTVLAARSLRDLGPFETETAMKANIIAAIDAVAVRLGNTRAVCRSSYIHPTVLLGYETGALCLFDCNRVSDAGLDPDECWALAFLKETPMDSVIG